MLHELHKKVKVVAEEGSNGDSSKRRLNFDGLGMNREKGDEAGVKTPKRAAQTTKGVGRMQQLAGGDGPEHMARGARRALSSREGDTARRFVGLKPEWEAAPAEDAY